MDTFLGAQQYLKSLQSNLTVSSCSRLAMTTQEQSTISSSCKAGMGIYGTHRYERMERERPSISLALLRCENLPMLLHHSGVLVP